MLFAEPRLILVLMLSIYVFAIIQPGKLRAADFSSVNNYCNHSVFQDEMPRALLHKDLREAALPTSFYRKLQQTSTESYSKKKTVLEKALRQYGFSATVENMLTRYSQQFY